MLSRLAMMLAVAGPLPVAAAEPPLRPEQVIDQRLAPLAGADRPGCVAGLIEQGRLTHVRAAGAADIATGRPLTAATTFNIASMSKMFTGAAVALLVQRGRLSMDDDVRRYLPELPDYGATIRVRDLVHHTSGLRNHMALTAYQPGSPLPSHADALSLVFRQSALNFRPGTRHQYESPGYVLLAEIVARASGRPFEAFLAEELFAPAGLRETGYASPRLSRSYSVAAGGGFAINNRLNGARGSSNLLSSVEDLARWLTALEAGRVGEPGLLEAMMAPGRLADGTAVTYSHGLQVARDHDGVPGLTRLGHGGQTAAYRSGFVHFPGRGFGAVTLCNVGNGPSQAGMEAAEAWVRQNFAPADPPAAAAATMATGEAADLAGAYLDPEGDELRRFTAEGETLNFLYAGQPYPLTPLGDRRFALGALGEFRFRDDAGTVRMTETGPNQPAIDFARLPAAGAIEPTDFAGRFRSTDVDGELSIGAGAEGLVMTLPFGAFPLRPIGRDSFTADGDFGHIHFGRAADGEVDAVSISTLSGIARLRFARIR